MIKKNSIDLEELEKYVQVRFLISDRSSSGRNTNLFSLGKVGVYRMRKCTFEDFEKRSFFVDKDFGDSMFLRLCPDIADDNEYYKVKNLYSNQKERISTSI